MLSALHTENSPFNEEQLGLLNRSLGTLDRAQSQWLSGFLAGRLGDSSPGSGANQVGVEPALTILYGSETGNGEGLAQALAEQFEQSGISAQLESLDHFRPAGLKKLKHAVFIMSTHGEGDPPEEAVELFEYLASERAPRLEELSYRVLALGDRSYEHFCASGRELDERLKALGATPFGERVECDVNYAAQAGSWSLEIIDHVKEHWVDSTSAVATTRLSLVPSKPRWTREDPYSAEVLKVQKITGDDSEKDIYHLELSLEESGLEYQPGDALGIWAPNDPDTVVEILSLLGLSSAESVKVDGRLGPLSKALAEQRELTRLSADTIEAYAIAGDVSVLSDTFQSFDAQQRREYIEQRQFADLVKEFPAKIEAQALVDLLRPLAPRSYSISSSKTRVDEEVHLTVATLHSNGSGTQRTGVASHYLNHRLTQGGQVKVFAEPNRRFHLPEDPNTPVIMIAAGTGIAPYRAFMQEIEETGNARDSWLIFGNPHLRTDFLYQREWLNWRESGLLNRIDTAWSRDGSEKHYVQQVVSEQSERLARWLDRGAHIYICGGIEMGQAVNEAIQQSLAIQTGTTFEEAGVSLALLQRTKRIHKDLY
ncbi:MAG: sulfite reductase (NADPH) flavoprotein alpha-component [Lysobacterales bacterium]|jgi:sulfite reductase (NADPH) flavoprotein alpha-component